MRVVLTDDVADHTGGLLVGLVPFEPQLVHAVEDAAVHRLQAVANIGQRTAHDHAHGVIEVRALHFFSDRDGANVARPAAGRCSLVVICQVDTSPNTAERTPSWACAPRDIESRELYSGEARTRNLAREQCRRNVHLKWGFSG